MNSQVPRQADAFGALQERFLEDPLPVRFGGLAANLARVESFSDHFDHCDAVNYLLHESQYFIEWTASDATLSQQVELVELQRLLARWRLEWNEIWNDPERRNAVAVQAGLWSQKILESSGLLNSPGD